MKILKDALITIRRSPYQSLLAVFMISMTFFVGYVFSLTLLGTEKTLRFFETSPQIVAFFELETEANDINKLALEMQGKSYVKEVKLVSKEEALEIYREDNKDNPLLLELVTADILPSSIEISAETVNDLSQIKQDLEEADGIEEVSFQQEIISSLAKWTKSIRLIGAFSTIVLATTSFLLMVVLIGMKVLTKKKTIKIMKIIGATSWYIIAPFILEGAIYGFLGSLLGWGGMYALLLYLTPWLMNFLGSIITLPVPWQVFAWQIGVGTSVGILLGGMASVVAVRRMIKR